MTFPEVTGPQDLLDSMAESDVLDRYLRLPPAALANFAHWIEIARDDESRWRRIDALVLAMRISPLRETGELPPELGKLLADNSNG